MRRRRAPKRPVTVDPQYRSKLVSELMNLLMYDGKKSIAESIVYGAMERVRQKIQKGEVLEIVQKAVDNARPLLELKSRRVGGATYQIPIEVRGERGTSIALRWIRNAARSRKGKSMEEKLADELVDAYNGQGTTIRKKEEIHKMAEANRAFSHYRW